MAASLRPGRKRPRRIPRELLYVARTLHFTFGGRLCGGESRINGRSARQCRGELLADGRAYSLKLGNCRILDPDVRNRLYRRLVWISAIDRRERELRKRGDLQVVGILIKRSARTRWHVCPAVFRGDKLDVVLAGRPRDEFFRRRDLLRTGWNGEIPRPKPIGILSQSRVRREREADLVGDL